MVAAGEQNLLAHGVSFNVKVALEKVKPFAKSSFCLTIIAITSSKSIIAKMQQSLDQR